MNPDSSCAAATRGPIVLSDEQTLCVKAATETQENLLISACAGGAKTTTMCAIARAFGPGRSVVALAFNKDAAVALAAKMPYYVQSQTFHSFCYDAIGRFLGRKPKADGNRCRFFLKDLVPDWKERRELEGSVLPLVSRFKTTTSTQCEQSLRAIAEQFDIEVTSRSLLLAEKILTACEETAPKSIDFDDMLWLAFRWNVPFPRVDVVLLDEAQDTNGVQRALLERMLGRRLECVQCGEETKVTPYCPHNPNGVHNGHYVTTSRLIAVGDPHQSIYGFRGADHDAMRALRDDFNMKELQLSVSYRCAISVVNEAQRYAGKTIQPRADAPDGTVAHLEHYNPETFRREDAAVLCRNTAPLVSFAFDLLARGVPCHIVGKDIQVGLEKLIDKIKGDTISGFRMDLVRHMEQETEKFRRKGKKEQAANFEDKCNALIAISRQCKSKDEVKVKLASIFRDGTGLTLSTIHKAKGLEWTTVFLLDWNLLPSPYAESEAALTQERNLQYVAVTRAKLNLKFINTGNWKV